MSRFKYCVTILLILEILVGITLICITWVLHSILVLYLAKSERQTLTSQLSNIYILGLELLVCYTFGLLFWRHIWKTGTIVEYWLLVVCNSFCLVVNVCGSTTVWFLYNSVLSLQNAAASSLFQGIDLYFSDPEWKLLLDEIQYHNECCGVDGYDDWKGAVWVPDEQSNCQSPYINMTLFYIQCEASYFTYSCQSNISILIPYACCKCSVSSCFENYAPHLSPVSVPYFSPSDINTSGYLPKFNYLTSQMFCSLACVMLTVFTLQIILLIFVLGVISTAKNDERPLVVVKYPRNVRCITLTDEENLEEVEVGEEHLDDRLKTTKGVSLRLDVTDPVNKNVFIH